MLFDTMRTLLINENFVAMKILLIRSRRYEYRRLLINKIFISAFEYLSQFLYSQVELRTDDIEKLIYDDV